jgi:hypothetical protein
MIKDCTKIADNTILADMTVVPPFGHFAGSPGGSSALFLSLSLFLSSLCYSITHLSPR